MSTLLDRRLDPAPAPPEPSDASDHRGSDGFVDCRDVFHPWSEED